MNNIILTAIAAAFLSFSWAATANAESLSDKVMSDHPGVTGGQTANPTARPDDYSGGLQRKAMKDHPGTAGGRTVSPLANADTDSIQAQVKERHQSAN